MKASVWVEVVALSFVSLYVREPQDIKVRNLAAFITSRLILKCELA